MQSDLIIIMNTDNRFYNLLGRYLSKREIVKETGITVWDDNDNYWFVLVNGTEVLGFSSIKIKDKFARINVLYVNPNHRNKLIGSKILESIVLNCIDEDISRIVVTSTEQGLRLYKKYGFIEIGKNGRYFKLMRRCE